MTAGVLRVAGSLLLALVLQNGSLVESLPYDSIFFYAEEFKSSEIGSEFDGVSKGFVTREELVKLSLDRPAPAQPPWLDRLDATRLLTSESFSIKASLQYQLRTSW